MFTYVARICRESRRELEDRIQGLERLPAADDTQVGEPLIRPFGHMKGRPIRDGFFVDGRGEPMMILSLHSPSRLLQRFFATPMQHIESYHNNWTIVNDTLESPQFLTLYGSDGRHFVARLRWLGKD